MFEDLSQQAWVKYWSAVHFYQQHILNLKKTRLNWSVSSNKNDIDIEIFRRAYCSTIEKKHNCKNIGTLFTGRTFTQKGERHLQKACTAKWPFSFTHLPLDKMATISTFSNAFSWMKSFIYWWKFHWSLFLRVQLIITQYWFRSWHGTE